MILVSGPTGHVGAPLLEELAGGGDTVRALVRRPETAEQVRAAGAEPVTADLDDPASLSAALEGVDRAFLLATASERQVEQERAFVDAAKAAGVSHLVKLSVIGADPRARARFGAAHGQVEGIIREAGVPFTFLRPNDFFQNALNDAPSIAADGRFYYPVPDARMSSIDARDIAAVAAAALDDPDTHGGETYTLTGAAATSRADNAKVIGEVLGKPVEVVQVSRDDARGAMLGVGVPEYTVDGLVELFDIYEKGYAAAVSPDVERVLGRPPRTFEAFVEDHRAAFEKA